jgi:hypothetical protein
MNKIIIGAVVTIVVGVVIAATGWNFQATAEMSEKFVHKQDLRIFIERNDKEHQRIIEKLDKIYDHLIEENRHE